jgi:hypothetical protein
MRWPSRHLGVSLLLLAACGGPTSPDRDWLEVKEETSCEALVPAFCVGTYGFTVHNDGRFTVGPAPNGASLTGTLSASEWTQFSAEVAAVATNLPGKQECDESPRTVPGVSDRVELLLARGGSTTVYALSAGGTCYVGGRDRATRLHDDLDGLTSRYYPRPFPQ